MKKIGILLIIIMLFSMIGVFDFGEFKATDWDFTDDFEDGQTNDWDGWTKSGNTTPTQKSDNDGNTHYVMQGTLTYTNASYHGSFYIEGTIAANRQVPEYGDISARLIRVYVTVDGTTYYTGIFAYRGQYQRETKVKLLGGTYDTVDTWDTEDDNSAIVNLYSFSLEVNVETLTATVTGIISDTQDLVATSGDTHVDICGNSGGIWTDDVSIHLGLNTKDFTSVEITSDKTHYDMTDTQAIFTVTVADADGPVTGCTIDETITLPDATTDTSLTWTDNGDGTYTSSPLTLDQYGMYQYECTVSKEGYNDGSDSGVFTRDEGPYQIIVQTNKPRYTRADTDIGTTVIVSDGNGDPVTGCTITGEITKYDSTTLASWSDWTNPTEGYYQHTVSIADLGVTGDNVECSFSAEVTIPEYDTVETGSVSFTLNYESGGGGDDDDENNGSFSLSLSNTNINYDSTTWSYSSTLIATVTDENGPLSGAQIDISTSPNGEGASPLVVSPSSGETGGDGTFSASISCNAFDAVNGYTATVTASYGGDSVTETIQITTEETGGDNDSGGGGGGYEAPDSDSSGNDANSPPNPHETPDDSPDDEGPNHIYIYCFDTQTYQESYEYRVGQEIYVGVKYTDSQGNLIHNATVMITHEGPTTEETESRILPSDLNYEYFECFDTSNWIPDEDHHIKVSAIDPRSGQIDKGSIKLKINDIDNPNKLYLQFYPNPGIKNQKTTIVVKDGNGDTVAGATVKIAKTLWWDKELGVTNGFGMLTYTFTDAKTYKIYAEKDGYEKSDEYEFIVKEKLNLELWTEDEQGNRKDTFNTDEMVYLYGNGEFPSGSAAPSRLNSFEFYPSGPAVRFKVRDPDEDTSWYDFEKGYIFLTESDTHYYREDLIEIKDSWSLHPKMEITWEFLAGKIPECYWGKKVEIYMDLWLGSRISIEYPCVGSVILYVNDEGVPEEHGTLDGYIKDVDSHGIGGAYVVIKGTPEGTGEVTKETYSDSSGYYDFWDTCFPYGQWELTVTKEGYQDKVETITIDEEHEHIDIVLSEEEAPNYNLEITAMVQYGEEKYIVKDAYITVNGVTKTTDSNGYVSFNLPEGTYGIVGHYTGDAGGKVPYRTFNGEDQVTLDSDKQIEFVMTTDESGDYILTVKPAKIDPNESATFTVVDKDNNPVSGVEIWRMSGDIKMFSIGTTNSQGQFTKTYDSSGSYTYKGFKGDKTTNKVTLQVGDTPAELGEVNLRVNGVVSYHAELNETVTLSVFDKEEKPLSGASIRAIQAPIGAKVDPLTTDGAGKVEFTCDHEGVYVFKASYEGTDSNEVDIGVGSEPPGWPDIWAFLKNIWNFLKGYGLFMAIGIICIVLGIFTKNSFLFLIGIGTIVISILGYEANAIDWIKDLLGGIT